MQHGHRQPGQTGQAQAGEGDPQLPRDGHRPLLRRGAARAAAGADPEVVSDNSLVQRQIWRDHRAHYRRDGGPGDTMCVSET